MGCSGTNEKQINIHENNEIYINNNFGFIPTQRYNFKITPQIKKIVIFVEKI